MSKGIAVSILVMLACFAAIGWISQQQADMVDLLDEEGEVSEPQPLENPQSEQAWPQAAQQPSAIMSQQQQQYPQYAYSQQQPQQQQPVYYPQPQGAYPMQPQQPYAQPYAQPYGVPPQQESNLMPIAPMQQQQQPMYQPVYPQAPIYQQPVYQQPAIQQQQQQQPIQQPAAAVTQQQPIYQQPAAAVQQQQPIYQQPAAAVQQQQEPQAKPYAPMPLYNTLPASKSSKSSKSSTTTTKTSKSLSKNFDYKFGSKVYLPRPASAVGFPIVFIFAVNETPNTYHFALQEPDGTLHTYGVIKPHSRARQQAFANEMWTVVNSQGEISSRVPPFKVTMINQWFTIPNA